MPHFAKFITVWTEPPLCYNFHLNYNLIFMYYFSWWEQSNRLWRVSTRFLLISIGYKSHLELSWHSISKTKIQHNVSGFISATWDLYLSSIHRPTFYLAPTLQIFHQNAICSDSHSLLCEVPHSSTLFLFLFNIYERPLGEVIQWYDMRYHQYTDDTQLYISAQDQPS